MLTWTTRNKNGIHNYAVYENDAEAHLHGITPIPLEDAQQGDYIRTDNGYFIPVMSRWSHKRRNSGNLFVQITFPNYTYKNTLFAKSGHFKFKPFLWSREPRPDSTHQKIFVTSNDKLFAFYLSEGMGLDTAFKIIYKKNLTVKQKNRIISRMMNNPEFIKYLKEKNIVDTLKQRFEKNGITDKYFIGQLQKILADKKEPVQMRMKALDICQSILLNEDGVINVMADAAHQLPEMSATEMLEQRFLKAGEVPVEVIDQDP